MHSQIAICCELLVTVRTTERFFISVISTMLNQISTISELLVTVRTGEGLFTRVNSTMHNQSATCSELHFTVRTSERLFTSVNSTMHNQSATCCELHFTVRTSERLFTSVNSTMHIQIAICCELLVTVRTSERFFISVISTMLNQNFHHLGTSCHSPDKWRALHPCEFYDAQSKCHLLWTSFHSPDKWTAFHQCEFYDAHSNRHFVWTFCHSPDRRMVFRQCELYDVYWNCHYLWTSCHSQDRRTAFHRCSALGSSRNTSEDDTSMQFFMYAGQVLSFQKTAGHKLYMLFYPRWWPKNKMAAEKQWTLISLCVEPVETSFFIYFIWFQGQGIHFCEYNIRKKYKMAAKKQDGRRKVMNSHISVCRTRRNFIFLNFICFQGQGIHFCKYNIRENTRWPPKSNMAARNQWTCIS